MTGWIRVRHPVTDAQAVIARSALPQHQLGGWEEAGDRDETADTEESRDAAQETSTDEGEQ